MSAVSIDLQLPVSHHHNCFSLNLATNWFARSDVITHSLCTGVDAELIYKPNAIHGNAALLLVGTPLI